MSPPVQPASSGTGYFLSLKWSELLIFYFRSGWAFLIPYLAAYLLYAWLKWPVNPVVSGQQSAITNQSMWVPCLLHIYWFLHATHLVLGGYALRIWWRSTRGPTQDTQRSTPNSPLDSLNPKPQTAWHRLYAVLPWLCLALIFWIPGVYLEWPSDPWEHLRRINEWRIVDIVTDHSSWVKSSYFIPYSIFTWSVGLRQIFWLDFYYTGICLLLCWQYYRLARACALIGPAAVVFVILQAVLFGNNVFSFYRYYGISSSIYAQLGAVALIRITLDAAKKPELLCGSFSITLIRPKIYRLLLCGGLLLVLVGFNHLQGMVITALGIGAIILWRLIEWKRDTLWLFIILSIVVNGLFLQFYPRSAIIESYRSDGFLNGWYGFNIFNLTSPAGDRVLQIVSIFGLLNFIAALVLLRRNHVVGWLTVMPFVALSYPIIAVSLAQSLSTRGGDGNIVVFQRMLFSIPLGLALVCLFENFCRTLQDAAACTRVPIVPNTSQSVFCNRFLRIPAPQGFLAFTLACLIIAAFVVTPSSAHFYNRTWHVFVVVPWDLRLRDVFSRYEAVKSRMIDSKESKIATNQAGAVLLASYNAVLVGPSKSRNIGIPVTGSISTAVDFLHSNVSEDLIPSASGDIVQTTELTESLNLIPDPMAGDSTAWIATAGNFPQFVSGIAGPSAASTALQNPAGMVTHAFTSAIIPIETLKTYRLEMNIKQVGNTNTVVFLALAWYGPDRKLLESNLPLPKGAGNPTGWVNGQYSYFGLVAQVPPTTWTTFGHSFGLNEIASIPRHACFVRIGALLNYNAIPSAVVQLTDVKLFQKETPAIGVAISEATSGYSSVSQAAQLSTHWQPHQVMVDRAGIQEIEGAEGTGYLSLPK